MNKLLKNKNRICTIVSHTAHHLDKDGIIVGFGPTIQEIDYLASLFSIVYHCAPFHHDAPNPSLLRYKSKNIIYAPLKPAGGKTVVKKLMHLKYYFSNFSQIKTCLKKSHFLHFRAPTSIGVLFLPWVLLFWKRGIWIKYAGSWIDESAPITYKFQRWLLKRFPKRAIITLNGNFEDQRGNFLEFFNPCFDNNTLHRATITANKKNFNGKLNLLFVGRLEQAKGLDDLMFLIEKMDRTDKINSLTIIGESKTLSKYENWAERLPVKVIFSGLLSRDDVFSYYARSHILVLLSKTEGFPKVIMEAGAFGCVSIVSDLPEICNVIKHRYNGFILQSKSGFIDNQNFQTIFNNRDELNFCSKNINNDAKDFTFEKYISAIENAFLHPLH